MGTAGVCSAASTDFAFPTRRRQKAAGRRRTLNLRFRRPLLYPAELQQQNVSSLTGRILAIGKSDARVNSRRTPQGTSIKYALTAAIEDT